MFQRQLLLITFATIANGLSLPQTSGPYNVGSKPFLFLKTTENDPVAPNGTGTSLILNAYYPTLENATETPYLWKGLADYYEGYYSVPSGAFSNITAKVAQGAPPLQLNPPLPTLIWSPGFAGPTSQMFFSLFSELVSIGYVVITVDHPGEQPYLEYPNGTGIPGLSEDYIPTNEFINRVHEYRIEDNTAVFDALEDIQNAVEVPLNLTHVALFGHSLGGSASLNTALIEKTRITPKIIGAIDIDGQIFPPAAWNDSSVDIGIPSLLMTSEQRLALGDPGFPTFVSWQSEWAREIIVHGKTNHTDFSDLVVWLQGNGVTGGEGAISAQRMVEVTRAFVKAFFDWVSGRQVGEGILVGNKEDRKNWPEVQFEKGSLD